MIFLILGKPNPEWYTGHCFRRTGATILAEAGLTMNLIKNAGDWKSASVAEGYIDSSDRIKQTIADAFSNVASSTVQEETSSVAQVVPSNKVVVVGNDENINPNSAKNYFVFHIA